MKVSIIVPIYNTEKYLNNCLESIRRQTFQNFEVVMVDDGSTDDCSSICEQYVREDKRFQLIKQQNQGVSVARNTGMKRATGDYILFVDSDDWIEKNMIEVLITLINEHDVKIAMCQYDHNPYLNISDIEIWESRRLIKEFLIHIKINGSLVNKLISKELLGRQEFDKNIKYGEDALFLWSILQNVDKMVINKQILYHVTLHDDSASGGEFKKTQMDGIKVWGRILEDVEQKFPEMRSIILETKARGAIVSLYNMMLSGYIDKHSENILISVIRGNKNIILKAKYISIKMKMFAIASITNALIVRKYVRHISLGH